MSERIFREKPSLTASTPLDAVTEAVHSAAFSGLQQPYNGLSQLVNRVSGKQLLPDVQVIDAPKFAEFGSTAWHAQQIGGAIGMTVPFLFVNKAVGGVAGRFLSAGARPGVRLAATIGIGGTSGALYEGIFQPVAADEPDFWKSKGKHALVGGITFATLAGVHGGVDTARASRLHPDYRFLTHKMGNRLVDGAFSGGIAGGVHAQAASLLDGKGFADLRTTTQSAYGFSFVGGALGAHKQMSEARSNRFANFLEKGYGKSWQTDPTMQVRSELLTHLVDAKPGLAPDRLPEYLDWLKPDILGMKDRAYDIGVWQGKERNALLAEVQKRAESPLGKEATLTRAIEGLADATKSWRGRDLEGVDTYLTQARTRAETSAAERVRIAEGIPELSGVEPARLLSDKSLIERHPAYKDALRREFEAESEVAQAERYLEVQFEARQEALKQAVNKIAKENDLPAVEFEVGSDGKFAGSYSNGAGKMMVHREFVKGETLKTQSLDTLLHEFTHFEQDVLVIRRLADGLEVGNVANFQQMGHLTKAYEVLTGESATVSFIERVLEHRDGRRLSKEQVRRADELMASFREYSRKGYTKGEFGEVDQIDRLRDIIDKTSTDEGLAWLKDQVTTDADLAKLLLGEPQAQPTFASTLSRSQFSHLLSREGAQSLIRDKAAKLLPAAKERYGGYIGSKLESEAWSVGLLTQVKARALGVRTFEWRDMLADFGTTGQQAAKAEALRPAALGEVGRVQTFQEWLNTASLDWIQAYRRNQGIDVRPFDKKLKAAQNAGK